MNNIGRYEVEIKISFTKDPDAVFDIQTVTVTVNPCELSSFEAFSTLDDFRYEIGSGLVKTSRYMFSQTPSKCGYAVTSVEVLNAPESLIHEEANQRFSIEMDYGKSESYSIQVTGIMEYPTDNTMS